ncbi:MAG: hypothetical protein LAO20_07275 [Acidobacteriia bacterium]|nr:hypothetical protein [Terriglobia bacterium]
MEIVKFWDKLGLNHPPFIHPDDKPAIERHKRQGSDLAKYDFDGFVRSTRFGAFEDHRFHLSLVPVPYAGNLAKADIFILLLNPGFDFVDYYGESRVLEFRQRIKQNLRQEFDGIEFPFLYLDPEFCWHGGFVWWEKKFRDVATKIAAEKFGGRYLDALRDLAHRVAAVELIPYHSISFRDHGLLKDLPSINQARRFAQAELAPRAKKGDVTIIVTRQSKVWGLGESKSRNIVPYEGGLTRGASLGSLTPGGKAILKRYGIKV